MYSLNNAHLKIQLKKLCDAMKENCKEPIAKKEVALACSGLQKQSFKDHMLILLKQSVTPVRLSLSVEDFLDSLLEDGDFQSHTQSVV